MVSQSPEDTFIDMRTAGYSDMEYHAGISKTQLSAQNINAGR